MILLIDNYDSFSYNLYQLIGSLQPDIKVMRNDEASVSDISSMKPQAIVLSPGPGRPEDAGICPAVVKELGSRIPILGVCLGHQVIYEAYGGRVDHASELMHGKEKPIRRQGSSVILDGLPEVFYAARYHSLAGVRQTLRQAGDHGDRAHKAPGFRTSVPSRIRYDKGWRQNDRQFPEIYCKMIPSYAMIFHDQQV